MRLNAMKRGMLRALFIFAPTFDSAFARSVSKAASGGFFLTISLDRMAAFGREYF
jgi:hypothetical protein